MACIGKHDHHQHMASDGRRLLAAFVVVFLFMIIEVIGGIVSGSLALLADAGHMLTDALALALAASAQWIAARPADRERHYGYARLQVLAAFVNGVALCALAVWIVVEAVQRLFATELTVVWPLMLAVAVLGFVANGAAFVILNQASTDNINIRGAMLHVIGDLMGSAAAVIAALTAALTGWAKVDPLLSMLIAVLVGRAAWRLVKETGHILLQGAPAGFDARAVSDALCAAFPVIEDIHAMRAWQMAPKQACLTMHMRLAASADATAVMEEVKQMLRMRYGVTSSAIQIEFGDDCPDCPDGAPPDDAYQRLAPAALWPRVGLFSRRMGLGGIAASSGAAARSSEIAAHDAG